jgi:SM-20-related protein
LPLAPIVDQDAIQSLIDGVAAHGYAVVADFLDAATITALRTRALALDAEGLFTAAAIGHGAVRVERADIRGDRIHWLGERNDDRSEALLFSTLETLRVAANRALQLGLFEFEGHYAIYPAGHGYARHLDRFRDDDARVLSVVLYLNKQWRSADGGALRLHLAHPQSIDVPPDGGTLVAFLSDRFAHEVLPATRQRLSIAGWFRRRE